MKMPIGVFLAIAVSVSVLAPAPAFAQDEVDWAVLPTDKAELEALDTKQLRMLRASVRYCEDFARQNHRNTACVFLDLDRAVRQSDDAALKTYHFGMSRMDRYSESRNRGAVVDRLLLMRDKALAAD